MDSSSLISIALSDMRNNPNTDCWLSRVEKIMTLFNLKGLHGKPDRIGMLIDRNIKSKFDRFYLEEINQVKRGIDGQDHNKLRFYKTLKGSFKIEPYIVQIKNRNQRHWLTRYRTSAHKLNIELGRYSRPVTPIYERKCIYCDEGCIDDESHFILICKTFKIKRQCFFSRLNVLNSSFDQFSCDEKLRFILCPPTLEVAKCVSKFLGIMTNVRGEIDMGLDPTDLNFYIKHVATIL